MRMEESQRGQARSRGVTQACAGERRRSRVTVYKAGGEVISWCYYKEKRKGKRVDSGGKRRNASTSKGNK
ncbi:hypothetical protein E2C01_096601 [Portunus trituberculatus]|uniref:Uncharacterized protein n=1 Tax=Portunus trituberculatus TaxID=210409 RepID=A0A5B7K7N3_PORTR|nr:hypothetical protein [Portunus trituberculatus]